MADLDRAINDTRAWACYDCGKCTATCPVSRAGSDFSPRHHVLSAVQGRGDDLARDRSIYSCLTCMMCDSRCPTEVAYTELVRELRELAGSNGQEPDCPHGGSLQSIMRMMARGETKQDRLAWLGRTLRTKPGEGHVFFWTGCAMYYDSFFTEYKLNALGGTRAALRLLNELDVEPVVSPEERCCGHDLLWNGDRASFEQLARHNVKLVEDSGAELLLTPCAECLRTWKLDYAPFFKSAPPKIMHTTEYLAEYLPALRFERREPCRVTFQDPCRMGRHLGIYEAPRKVLELLPGVEFVEMEYSGKRATCCAGGTWSSCDRYAKRIQVDRLREARATGAQYLVTACPKCQIHFNCAMKDPQLGEEIRIEMRDLSEMVVEALETAAVAQPSV